MFSDWRSLHCGEAALMIDSIAQSVCGRVTERPVCGKIDDEMASRRLKGRMCAEGPSEGGMASCTSG